MRRVAMIALIDQIYGKVFGEALGDRLPVIGRSEKTVKDEKRPAPIFLNANFIKSDL